MDGLTAAVQGHGIMRGAQVTPASAHITLGNIANGTAPVFTTRILFVDEPETLEELIEDLKATAEKMRHLRRVQRDEQVEPTPWSAGHRANDRGQALSSNPHPLGSPAYVDWVRGWKASDEQRLPARD